MSIDDISTFETQPCRYIALSSFSTMSLLTINLYQYIPTLNISKHPVLSEPGTVLVLATEVALIRGQISFLYPIKGN
jgi:hypothetical protein